MRARWWRALARAPVQLAVAVTGIAGPVAWCRASRWARSGWPGAAHGAVQTERLQLDGDRAAVRATAAAAGGGAAGGARAHEGAARRPDRRQWRRELAAAMPEALGRGDCDDTDAAVVANPPPGALAGQRQLRLVQSLWTGVERLLADETCPGVPLAHGGPARRRDGQTALGVLALHRGFFDYQAQAARRALGATPPAPCRRSERCCCGPGEMGGAVGRRLALLDYRLAGLAPRVELAPLLATADIVISLLPLTPTTRAACSTLRFSGGLWAQPGQPGARRARRRSRPAGRAGRRPPAPRGAGRLRDRAAADPATRSGRTRGVTVLPRGRLDRPAQRQPGGGSQPARPARRRPVARLVDRGARLLISHAAPAAARVRAWRPAAAASSTRGGAGRPRGRPASPVASGP